MLLTAPQGTAKLGSVIYRAVAATLLDWLLEAGPVLLVDVDEGALLHSFGPEPHAEEALAESRRLRVEAIEAHECVACTA
eukprot:scaffold113272_cov66-Phaeocystis_antarctica.AAC.1